MKEQFVIVPQSDIDAIETARKTLHEMVENDNILSVTIFGVTQPMYILTHRRYPVKKSLWDKILDFWDKM